MDSLIYKEAYNIVLSQAKPLKIKTSDDKLIETKVLWFYKEKSDYIKLMYQTIETENYVEAEESCDELIICFKYIRTNEFEIFIDEPYNASIIVSCLIFLDKYLLNDLYEKFCDQTIKYYDNNDVIDDKFFAKFPFFIIKHKLPKNSLYDTGLKSIKKLISNQNTVAIFEEIANYFNYYENIDQYGIMFAEMSMLKKW